MKAKPRYHVTINGEPKCSSRVMDQLEDCYYGEPSNLSFDEYIAKEKAAGSVFELCADEDRSHLEKHKKFLEQIIKDANLTGIAIEIVEGECPVYLNECECGYHKQADAEAKTSKV